MVLFPGDFNREDSGVELCYVASMVACDAKLPCRKIAVSESVKARLLRGLINPQIQPQKAPTQITKILRFELS
jgi:hypothetical protein